MTEGVDDGASAGLVVVVIPGAAASPAGSPGDATVVPKLAPEEEEEEGDEERREEGGEAEGESPKGGEDAVASGDEDDDAATDAGERGGGALGLLGLAGASCCVCLQMEQVRGCLRSEKICILPILACLLSLALCTAGLKWVFVDKIFEYDPPKHMGMGQDPFVILADPTLGLPLTPSRPSTSVSAGLSTTTTVGQPEVIVDGKPARVTQRAPTSALTRRADTTSRPASTTLKWTPTPHPKSSTPESNDIVIPTYSAATSTTPAVKTSSHVTPCSDAQKNYCVNGGECFTLEVTPGRPKFLCRCLSGFTGNRCQATVPVRVMNPKQAEELYQKRVLTITGICIALLVVGIMCVVAYCKTKKQRKKFQDRLRQSIRSERNHMASSADNGAWPPAPSNPPPPPENVQLVNQYLSKNAMPAQHAVEKESETSFSTSQYTSSAPQRSTTVTRTASQCWTNGRSESVPSDTRSASVRSSASGSQRGRLHGTAGANRVKASAASPRVCGDTPMDCCRDSPYSERYVSAMTTPTRPSPAHPAPPLSPVTPGSPPSEASAPLSSVATSVVVTPAADEERPLLFATPPRPRDRQKRNSAHYNHGLEAASPPPSPLAAVRDDDYQITHEHELRQDGPGEAGGLTAAAATAAPPATSPHGLPQKLTGNSSNNNNGRQAKRTKASAGRRAADGDPGRSSSESETEDEQAGEDTPFLSLQNPMVLGLALSLEVAPSSSSSSSSSSSDSSRTNPALLLSPQDELQARLSSAIAHQDPIAV